MTLLMMEKKARTFLSTIGPTAYHTLGNLLAPGKPFEKSYDDVVTVLKSFYCPKQSVIYSVISFIVVFVKMKNLYLSVAKLLNLAKDCEFGEGLKENLRDELACAVNDHVMQKSLLSEEKLTFKKPLK